ncbi:hypothetical protein JXB02_00595 [Candidatus Woesearchaeota archaeon]|nr:hypothetical protein [Candidatus Woesearchaeota archaeon]
MKTKYFVLPLIIVILALVIIIDPQPVKYGSMKLLAVSETDDGLRGAQASLSLQIRPGSGKVFIDSFPLTKLDTQMSTRFAMQFACNALGINCRKYDFFYTIRAEAPLIGGPSAGAATTLLTMTTLRGWEPNRSVSVTGTINSGGIIGPVGGLSEKIESAAHSGLALVLIPEGERIIETGNGTIDLVEYGDRFGIRVREVSTIYDILRFTTGKDISRPEGDLLITDLYTVTMRDIALRLCQRSAVYLEEIGPSSHPLMNATYNLTRRADKAIESSDYYSAASYCFGANINLQYMLYLGENMTTLEMLRRLTEIEKIISDVDEGLDAKTLMTITDLQAYMIVKERLIESEDYLRRVLDDLEENRTDTAVYDLAYANERLYSALSWSLFFNNQGKRFSLDESNLKETCAHKIAEAQERFQYITYITPFDLESTGKGLEYAMSDYNDGRYELCIFKATKAKAEADVILSAMGVPEEKIVPLIQRKLGVIEDLIVKELSQGIFPILGYSYYEYTRNLLSTDIYSSLIYSEYALEHSDIELYFKDFDEATPVFFDIRTLLVLLLGILIGVFVMETVWAKRIRALEHGAKKRQSK